MKQRAIPLETETPERETATAGCTVSSTSVSSLLANSFYDKRWFKTASVLRTDPSLMTSKLLIVALKNKAPLHVIKFFIRVNPEAAGIPKEGPTPLQVAVQYNASKEVVQELLQACPFALVVTTNAEWLDPLTYARRFRSSEIELIALLSRPLGMSPCVASCLQCMSLPDLSLTVCATIVDFICRKLDSSKGARRRGTKGVASKKVEFTSDHTTCLDFWITAHNAS